MYDVIIKILGGPKSPKSMNKNKHMRDLVCLRTRKLTSELYVVKFAPFVYCLWLLVYNHTIDKKLMMVRLEQKSNMKCMYH